VRLGPYEVLSPLGAGGMGEVYKARDTRLDRVVAIKVLPQHLSASAEVRQRFEREAKTISQLSHPHICALYDIGNQDGVEYLVMEYLEGETLADRLVRGALPLEQTLRYGIEIAGALDKAHRQGIVHRDLKPGNVMLTKSGVKLLDFGLARLQPSREAPALHSLSALPTEGKPLTQEGTILGTFQYMAPEQLEGREADVRTDIFALGAVLYEMVTGRKAFSGTSQASLITAIMSSEPAPIPAVQPLAPPALDRIVRTCLAKDPEDRWQSAADLSREVRWIAEGSPAGVAAAAPARGRSRREWVAWAIAGVLLAAGLYLADELRQVKGIVRPAVHSFLVEPENTTFHLIGDDAAPIALSPDGERAVFGAGGKLWVESLRTGAAVPLAGTEAGTFPFWSPDSRSIGFFSEGKLKSMDATGGPPQTICSAPNSRGGAWSSSGVIVFAPDVRSGLLRVPASGGVPAPLTNVDLKLHTTHRWPHFLPDGQHVLYLAANHAKPQSDQSGIYVTSLDGKENRRLLSGFGSAQYASGWLLLVRDTSLVGLRFDPGRLSISGEPVRIAENVNFDSGVWRGTFTASGNGVLAYQLAQGAGRGQLTWFDFSGRRLGTVGEPSQAYSPRISPDGRRASVVLGDPNNDIWIYELERGVRTRLTTDGLVNVSPLWSRNGAQILFSFQAGPGEFVLSTMASDGSGQRRDLYRSRDRIEPTDWSPDGRALLCAKGNIGAFQMWVIPLAEPSRGFALVPGSTQNSGQFSPDGRWVAYMSRETGQYEVFVTPFPPSGAHWQVSANGGVQPHWSADGRELYFVSRSAEMMAASVNGRGPRFEVGQVRPLFRVNIYTGPRTEVLGYDVSPDGKRFLVNSAGEAGVPRVALVTNWTAGLPK
jgi:Tol biopolymer transport system component/predicted Ser/Thr protein kinase